MHAEEKKKKKKFRKEGYTYLWYIYLVTISGEHTNLMYRCICVLYPTRCDEILSSTLTIGKIIHILMFKLTYGNKHYYLHKVITLKPI